MAPIGSDVSDLIAADIDAYLAPARAQEPAALHHLRLVDDGKSTLIGRLLYDSKMIFEDQLAALEADSKQVGTQGGEIDFALLVDGLAAEREQGITIDVAYRFFSTDKRKFIVADTPGHEQYTRNMVTGASTADLAVILIDARKGVLTQTRRHTLPRLAARHPPRRAGGQQDGPGRLVDQARFDADRRRLPRLRRARSASSDVTAIPMSALQRRQHRRAARDARPGTTGPTLMEHLETVEVDEDRLQPRRSACRCSGSTARTSTSAASPARSPRGIGRSRATRCRALPSGRESTVARIVTADGDLPSAVAGQSVTLTLADEIDVSRGDVLAAADAPAGGRRPVRGHRRLDGRGAAAARPPLSAEDRRRARVGATVTELKYQVNVNTLEHLAGQALELNEIGVCNLVARPADRLRSLCRQPRHRRLHPDRPDDQRAPSAPA